MEELGEGARGNGAGVAARVCRDDAGFEGVGEGGVRFAAVGGELDEVYGSRGLGTLDVEETFGDGTGGDLWAFAVMVVAFDETASYSFESWCIYKGLYRTSSNDGSESIIL